MVSGAAALVLAMNPNLDPATLRYLLAQGVNDLGVVGRDDEYGEGALDGSYLYSQSSTGIRFPELSDNFAPKTDPLFVHLHIPANNAAAHVFIGVYLVPYSAFVWLERTAHGMILRMKLCLLLLPCHR